MKSVELIREPRPMFTVRGMFLGLATLLLGVAVFVTGCSKESPAGGASGERPGEASDVRVTLSLASDGPLHAASRGVAGSAGRGKESRQGCRR